MRATRSVARALRVALIILLLPTSAFAASLEMMTTGGCECCHAWARHLRDDGFEVTIKELAMGQLAKLKLDEKIPPELNACHTGKIDGYLIEGHVPSREIRRLLAARLNVRGLIVAGMPIGSPGMESGQKREAYDVLLLKTDGSTEVFARYSAVGE